MLATYDLERQPTTFDVVIWLVKAKSAGASAVSFINRDKIQVKKYSAAVAEQRFNNIVLPACELAGLPVVDGVGKMFTHLWVDCPNDPWKFFYSRKYDHTTVTIRDSFRNLHRNSNRPAWERFAKETGAIVIDDADKAPMSLSERWDLYQCRMNYFVDNGPAALCYFSDAPYVSMKWKLTQHHVNKTFFRPGYQFPWANRDQRLMWEDDTYENIKRAACGS